MASRNSADPSGKGGCQEDSSQSSSSGRSSREADYYSSFLSKLLEVIGHADDASMARVIAAVRSGAEHEQILRLIEEISQNIGRSGGSA